MSLACRDDDAADVMEEAQRRLQAPAAAALLQLSGVLGVRAATAAAGLAQANLERLDQRIYVFQSIGRDLTTAAICEALTILAGEAGAVRAREDALGLGWPAPGQHNCQNPGCSAFVDCPKAAAHEFCDGPEPHLCPSCQENGK